jgi:hypothetical protein
VGLKYNFIFPFKDRQPIVVYQMPCYLKITNTDKYYWSPLAFSKRRAATKPIRENAPKTTKTC